MKLFRAHACLHPNTAGEQDALVFFEASCASIAPVVLNTLLCLAWNCERPDLLVHSVQGEDALLAQSRITADAGDVRLLETGWFEGPRFCAPEHTLVLARPATVQRLLVAQERARTWRAWEQVRRELRLQAPLAARHLPQVLRRAGDGDAQGAPA